MTEAPGTNGSGGFFASMTPGNTGLDSLPVPV